MDILGSVMALFTLGTGVALTFRSGFFQFTHLGKALAAPFRGRRRTLRGGGVTAFQAMATALGSSIGTANIAGVAGAILLGGPGAVFWMWMAGLFGMASKLSEIVLALRYRDMGVYPPSGGPMYYIEKGLGRRFRPLAKAFSAFGCIAGLLGTAIVQSNTIAASVSGLAESLYPSIHTAAVRLGAGLAFALLCGAVIIGGAKRIGAFSEKAVPFMAALYAAACCAVIYIHRARIAGAFVRIIGCAFSPRSAAGGLMGAGFLSAFRVGTARGVYSNEAGVGSGAIAHAASAETDPVRQGLFGIFEVFIDTMLVCTLTALVILTSFGSSRQAGGSDGMRLITSAFASVFGRDGASLLLSVSILLFAFTSLVGWSLYGEKCAAFLFGGRAALPYRLIFVLLIPLGSVIGAGPAWKLGELCNYLMAAPNLIALLLLSGKVKRELDSYKMFEKSRGRHYNKGKASLKKVANGK